MVTKRVILGTSNNDKITDTDRHDVIKAFAGNDTVHAGHGIDDVYGGFGNDKIYGGRGTDTLFGQSGDDTLVAHDYGNTIMYGGEGRDKFVIKPDGSSNTAGDVDTIMDFKHGEDKIYLNYFNEIYSRKYLTIKKEGDYYIVRNLYKQEEGDLYLKVKAPVYLQQSDFVFLDYAGATIKGTSGNDYLVGRDGLDHMYGGSGNDVIKGGLRNDGLNGEAGDDHLLGESGDDGLHGGDGKDYLQGGTGNDLVSGDNGNDTLQGNNGNDILEGGAGNDFLNGGAGSNTALYRNAASGVTVDLRITTAQDTGGDGVDILRNIQILSGSDYADILTGGDGNDGIGGDKGADILNGGDGNDVLYGDEMFYTYSALNGTVPHYEYYDRYHLSQSDTTNDNDTLNGGNGNDILRDLLGNNILNGDAGDDQIKGQGTLNGAAGNDVISGLGHLNGGDGNDTLYAGSGQAVTLDGGNGNDKLYGWWDDATLKGGAGDDYISTGLGTEHVWGGSGKDTFHLNLDAYGEQLMDSYSGEPLDFEPPSTHYYIEDFERGQDKMKLNDTSLNAMPTLTQQGEYQVFTLDYENTTFYVHTTNGQTLTSDDFIF